MYDASNSLSGSNMGSNIEILILYFVLYSNFVEEFIVPYSNLIPKFIWDIRLNYKINPAYI